MVIAQRSRCSCTWQVSQRRSAEGVAEPLRIGTTRLFSPPLFWNEILLLRSELQENCLINMRLADLLLASYDPKGDACSDDDDDDDIYNDNDNIVFYLDAAAYNCIQPRIYIIDLLFQELPLLPLSSSSSSLSIRELWSSLLVLLQPGIAIFCLQDQTPFIFDI